MNRIAFRLDAAGQKKEENKQKSKCVMIKTCYFLLWKLVSDVLLGGVN